MTRRKIIRILTIGQASHKHSLIDLVEGKTFPCTSKYKKIISPFKFSFQETKQRDVRWSVA